ncbi:uncharacterized protein A4U43_C01F25030 [Asparagus officinalis]|uniref:Uncharacterized protein n=1 Tax=Asparagus officinalis TaxID=4686 RepID=A0A5P1FTS7_ASPOF|nr:uncharacterized protein A4U43_C01F25030 [Asparagus officinalis]
MRAVWAATKGAPGREGLELRSLGGQVESFSLAEVAGAVSAERSCGAVMRASHYPSLQSPLGLPAMDSSCPRSCSSVAIRFKVTSTMFSD